LTNFINKIRKDYIFRSFILTFLITLLLLLPIGLLLDRHYKNVLLNSKKENIKSELERYSILLSREINQKFSLLNALEVFTKENWNNKISESGFKKFAYGLFSSTSGIRNLVIAPDGINKYVYPVKDNEETVGHNLIKDKRSNVRQAVQKTINNREFVASGPYKLRQGGEGIILRKALYKNDNFWGLVTMALNMETIYEYIKLENQNSSINIALKRKDKVFFGENNLFEKSPIITTVEFQGGKFTIGGIPEKNWYSSIENDLQIYRLIIFSIIILLVIIVYIVSYRNFKIQAVVNEKTRYLKEMNSLLQEKENVIKVEKDLIEYQAYHDQLTELYNRRFFEEEIERLDTKRQLPISIIMADVNGLKIINDTYGHSAGDELLEKTAEILNDSIRQEDILARWAGDEFVILLPQTTLKKAQKIMKRMKEECEKVGEKDIPISIGMGVATKKRVDQNIKKVLEEADNNMYQNKLSESRSVNNKIVQNLINTLGTKSSETREHAMRMTGLAHDLGEKLGLTLSEMNNLSLLATLHDIGKTTISEEILNKPGNLTEKEWEIIKEHPERGYKITSASKEFAVVAEDILHHHEHWNGNGYPDGLQGKEIPYLARIISIIDAYDVMTNERPYSEPISPKEALVEIKGCSGEQFDPNLVKEFIEMQKNKFS